MGKKGNRHEGDTIEIKNGEVYRNGIKLEGLYKRTYKNRFEYKVTVPKGHVFVMGTTGIIAPTADI